MKALGILAGIAMLAFGFIMGWHKRELTKGF